MNGGQMENTQRPKCQLIGENGNVFAIIGLVSRTLKKAGQPEQAKEFTSKAFASGSYDEVLNLCQYYVEVE
jgi:hypothetical protein